VCSININNKSFIGGSIKRRREMSIFFSILLNSIDPIIKTKKKECSFLHVQDICDGDQASYKINANKMSTNIRKKIE
jgi:hypothetical protein